MNNVCKEIAKRWKSRTCGDAIRKNCLECAGDHFKEVTLCPVTKCPLWGHRMGSILTSKEAQERFELAQKQHPEEFAMAFGGEVKEEDVKEGD